MLGTMNRHEYSTSYFFLSLLATLAIIFGGYIFLEGQALTKAYDAVLSSTTNETVKSISLPEAKKPFNIPSWSLFKPGELWSLVSRTEVLPSNYKAPDIIQTSVAHADDASQVSSRIEAPLRELVAAAEKDGNELMLSSAYRSIQDQQALYDEFVTTKGKAMADLYVAQPGTSEHHTGLAIDFANTSSTCETDSNTCNLDSAAATWLEEHASSYGFILRYPEGKKPITGIAYEPWHYRYVGKPLARAVTESGLTLDEVLEQMYPAFAIR
jgi:zinc D-Ala-D-Ala carboxypeptidase